MTNGLSNVDKETMWTPGLFGPIIKEEHKTLREVLNTHRDDECTRMIATFVPEELFYEPDLSKKYFRHFHGVLALIDISHLYGLYDQYRSGENEGSYGLIGALNTYLNIMMTEIYSSKGDVLKFSPNGVLAVWKVHRDNMIFKTVHKVILCVQRIQEYTELLTLNSMVKKVSTAISAGKVTFSIIGDDRARHFLIVGKPIDDLKLAYEISLPGDLVLCSSAWEHCSPSRYEYVIKDSNNVKIIKVRGKLVKKDNQGKVTFSSPTKTGDEEETPADHMKTHRPSIISHLLFIDHKWVPTKTFADNCDSHVESRRQLGIQLRPFLLKPVIHQIENAVSLEYLTETRQLTVACVNVFPIKFSTRELIMAIDQVFLHVQSIVERYSGCINMMNLYDKKILFCVTFGLKDYSVEEQNGTHSSEGGICSAVEIMKTVRRVAGIRGLSIGLSTGLACCGVIGHPVRRDYMIFSAIIDRAMGLMEISRNKICCDYGTVLNSGSEKKKFLCTGLKSLNRIGKCQVYEYSPALPDSREVLTSVKFCYPILDRFKEIECFKDILDEIGVPDRRYSGLLIKGVERVGKSRLLDAYLSIVRNRQLKHLKLTLLESYADKAFCVMHYIFAELLNCEDCKTIEERERILLSKLCGILSTEDFCYLNVIMRVKFPLSSEYCSASNWKRQKKTMKIFSAILNKIGDKICILLDDVNYMDPMSWHFLSIVLNGPNVVVVFTLLVSTSRSDLSPVERDICENKRLMKQSVYGLNTKFLAAFACQFLNVLAVSKTLEKILQSRSGNRISWCEAFFMSALQTKAVHLIDISPTQVDSYNLVFPDALLSKRISIDLTPEELAPPLHWTQLSSIRVCVVAENSISNINLHYDVTGLRKDIYYRMNRHEQQFIKCAATLGRIFRRNMPEGMIDDYSSVHTAEGKLQSEFQQFTVAEMIRLRILECAMIQRKDFHPESTHCFDKQRITFSNMHYMMICYCRPAKIPIVMKLPIYAHCKLLEFTITSIRKMFYGMLSQKDKKEYHSKAAKLLTEEARKCNTCGGGKFLRVPLREIMENKTPVKSTEVRRERRASGSNAKRRSIFTIDNNYYAKKRENTDIRKVSILPVHDIWEENSEVSRVTSSLKVERYLIDLSRKLTQDSFFESESQALNHVDYRSCGCVDIVNCVFYALHRHIKKIGDIVQMLEFAMEYGAALTATGQPNYTVKLLPEVRKIVETAEEEKEGSITAEDMFVNKGIFLALMGDAHRALGNYAEAKKMYVEAVTLRMNLLGNKTTVCYNLMIESLRHMFLGFPDYILNKNSGETGAAKLELASHLRRLSSILLMEDERKVTKLRVLQSLRAGFESEGSFIEKGEIYVNAVKIFRDLQMVELIRPLEKPMLSTMDLKSHWKDPDEISVVARVFRTMYNTRLLSGELSKAIEMGEKVLQICNALEITAIKLEILPSLIEVMIWTKHVNESVDLLRELYFLSDEDIDQSAITWYYALSLEILLDAGIMLESFETCRDHFNHTIGDQSKVCVSRDPESLSRLMTCISIWQLRMAMVNRNILVQNVGTYIQNIKYDNISQIFNCIKALECYLLLLMRRVNIKASRDVIDRLQDADRLVKMLNEMSKNVVFIRPFLHVLESYLKMLRGRKSDAQISLRKAQRCASQQGNMLVHAWAMQNKRTWMEASYNNMAEYWVEHVGIGNGIRWQNIHKFNLVAWSSIMFPFPVPDSYL